MILLVIRRVNCLKKKKSPAAIIAAYYDATWLRFLREKTNKQAKKQTQIKTKQKTTHTQKTIHTQKTKLTNFKHHNDVVKSIGAIFIPQTM